MGSRTEMDSGVSLIAEGRVGAAGKAATEIGATEGRQGRPGMPPTDGPLAVETLALLGAREIVRLIEHGRVPVRQVWMGSHAAVRYRKLVSAGFVRSESAQQTCWKHCVDCIHRTETETSIAVPGSGTVRAVSHWCGPALEPNAVTCGCLVGLTIGGRGIDGAMPAGKTVADERAGVDAGVLDGVDVRHIGCPMGRW